MAGGVYGGGGYNRDESAAKTPPRDESIGWRRGFRRVREGGMWGACGTEGDGQAGEVLLGFVPEGGVQGQQAKTPFEGSGVMFGWFYRRVGQEVAKELRRTDEKAVESLGRWERELVSRLYEFQRRVNADWDVFASGFVGRFDKSIRELELTISQERDIKEKMLKSLEATFVAKGRYEKTEESLHEITGQLMEREIARMNGSGE